MSQTEQILDEFVQTQGWTPTTCLDLALTYIENQADHEGWRDYLTSLKEVDDDIDVNPGPMPVVRVRVRIPNFGRGPVATEKTVTLLGPAPGRPDKVLVRDEWEQVFQIPEADIIEEV